jgi:hypothetical protein
MVRAGTLHTIQQRLESDMAQEGCRGGKRPRRAAAVGGPAKHTPLMLRWKEPSVEERMQKLEASRAAAEAEAAAVAAGGGQAPAAVPAAGGAAAAPGAAAADAPESMDCNGQ